MLQPGDVIAEKYRLVRLIGEGGMGAVFEAHHELIGKRLAIKVLKPHLVENVEAVGRFTREARAAAAIGHPAIIDVHDLGTAPDGSLFLVMEFLEGQSLGHVLEREGAVAPPFAAYVACQVLSALDAAHGKGIIHRDLKPDNVFLVDGGQAVPEVKLLDFGISKIVDRNDPGLRMTQTGEVLGTPYYMSPEQARGATDLDHRVDLYAMGVVLYEAMTGRRPFEAANYLALVAAVVADTPAPPSVLRPDVSEALEAVILTAMAKDPAARYATAAQMLEALLPFVDEHACGHLTLGKVTTSSGQAMASRRPVTGSASGANRLARSNGSGSTSWRDGEPPARPRRVGLFVALGLAAVVLLLGGGLGALALVAASREGQAALPPPTVARDAAPEPPTDAGMITISLDGLGDDARVIVDGVPVEGRVIQRPRSDAAHDVLVMLGDREVWRGTVRFDHDAILAVPTAPPAAAAAPDAAADAAADAGPRPAAADARVDASGPADVAPPPAPTKRSRRTSSHRIGRSFE